MALLRSLVLLGTTPTLHGRLRDRGGGDGLVVLGGIVLFGIGSIGGRRIDRRSGIGRRLITHSMETCETIY